MDGLDSPPDNMGKELPLEAFLQEIYKQTNCGTTGTNYRNIGEALGLVDRVSFATARALAAKGLIRIFLGGNMIMTDDCALYVEGYDAPRDEVGISVPINIGQIIGGDVNNSQIQVNSPRAHQNQVFEQIDNSQLLALLQNINDSISAMRLSAENETSLRSEIAGVKEQLEAGADKERISQKIRRICSILRTSSEIATVGAFVFQLLPLIGV